MLAPEHAICDRARLGQDLTYGEVRFDLAETVRSRIYRTLTRFSSAQAYNVRVYSAVISYFLWAWSCCCGYAFFQMRM